MSWLTSIVKCSEWQETGEKEIYTQAAVWKENRWLHSKPLLCEYECHLFYFLFCKHIAVTRPFFWCHGFLKSIWRNKILKTKLNIRNKSSVSKFANYFKVYVSTQWCCEMYCYKAFHTCCPFHSCEYTVILWNDMLQSFLYVLSCPLVWVPALLFPEKKALVVTKYVRFISHWQHQISCGLIHI